jgi:hypothetical protein
MVLRIAHVSVADRTLLLDGRLRGVTYRARWHRTGMLVARY